MNNSKMNLKVIDQQGATVCEFASRAAYVAAVVMWGDKAATDAINAHYADIYGGTDNDSYRRMSYSGGRFVVRMSKSRRAATNALNGDGQIKWYKDLGFTGEVMEVVQG